MGSEAERGMVELRAFPTELPVEIFKDSDEEANTILDITWGLP